MGVLTKDRKPTTIEPLTRQQAVRLRDFRVMNTARAMGRIDVCGMIPVGWSVEDFLADEEKTHDGLVSAITTVSPRQMGKLYPDSLDHEGAHQDKLDRRGYESKLGILGISDGEDQPVVVVTNFVGRLKEAAQREGLPGIQGCFERSLRTRAARKKSNGGA